MKTPAEMLAEDLQALLRRRPDLSVERYPFTSGTVFVQEGFTHEANGAFLVLQGTLVETQMHFFPNVGHTSHVISRISPGGIAFVQGLDPEHALLPAMTTIKAETDGELILINGEWLNVAGYNQRLLSAEVRTRRSILQVLSHIQLACKVEMVFRSLADQMIAENPNRLWSAEAIKASLVTAMNARKRLEESNISERRAAQESRAMMKEAVQALDEERERMTLRALGWELYYDRLQKTLSKKGISRQELALNADEALLFLGEAPDNVSEITEHARLQRRLDLDLDDTDFNANFDAAFPGIVAPREEGEDTIDEVLNLKDILPLEKT